MKRALTSEERRDSRRESIGEMTKERKPEPRKKRSPTELQKSLEETAERDMAVQGTDQSALQVKKFDLSAPPDAKDVSNEAEYALVFQEWLEFGVKKFNIPLQNAADQRLLSGPTWAAVYSLIAHNMVKPIQQGFATSDSRSGLPRRGTAQAFESFIKLRNRSGRISCFYEFQHMDNAIPGNTQSDLASGLRGDVFNAIHYGLFIGSYEKVGAPGVLIAELIPTYTGGNELYRKVQPEKLKTTVVFKSPETEIPKDAHPKLRFLDVIDMRPDTYAVCDLLGREHKEMVALKEGRLTRETAEQLITILKETGFRGSEKLGSHWNCQDAVVFSHHDRKEAFIQQQIRLQDRVQRVLKSSGEQRSLAEKSIASRLYGFGFESTTNALDRSSTDPRDTTARDGQTSQRPSGKPKKHRSIPDAKPTGAVQDFSSKLASKELAAPINRGPGADIAQDASMSSRTEDTNDQQSTGDMQAGRPKQSSVGPNQESQKRRGDDARAGGSRPSKKPRSMSSNTPAPEHRLAEPGCADTRMLPPPSRHGANRYAPFNQASERQDNRGPDRVYDQERRNFQNQNSRGGPYGRGGYSRGNQRSGFQRPQAPRA